MRRDISVSGGSGAKIGGQKSVHSHRYEMWGIRFGFFKNMRLIIDTSDQLSYLATVVMLLVGISFLILRNFVGE